MSMEEYLSYTNGEWYQRQRYAAAIGNRMSSVARKPTEEHAGQWVAVDLTYG